MIPARRRHMLGVQGARDANQPEPLGVQMEDPADGPASVSEPPVTCMLGPLPNTNSGRGVSTINSGAVSHPVDDQVEDGERGGGGGLHFCEVMPGSP